MHSDLLRLGLMCLYVLGCVRGAHADDEIPTPPSIGDTVPIWTDLKGTDDKAHSLSDWKGRIVVVCFTCNTCPYAVDYEDRLIKLTKKFSDNKDVRIVAVNSNAISSDSMEKMKERAQEKGFNFPYLKDSSQGVAKAWGAVYTPEFFVVDRNRKLIYKGAMDDSTKAEHASKNYVQRAVEAALKNDTPETTAVGARGCTIRFKRRRR